MAYPTVPFCEIAYCNTITPCCTIITFGSERKSFGLVYMKILIVEEHLVSVV
jgi:hypothetical protein